ncbi:MULTISPECIES: DUF4912 domain-containing protein [unclassified Nitrospina]|uniref:DUF4912 domain-containing protein n=1 Tax=unclassified Nitrospina TaxID=2638683 RepID=UPI003F9789A7
MKPSDLSKMTRQQLQNLARRKKIPVSSSLLKNEMVSKIGRELRKQEKQKAAGGKGPAGKTTARKTGSRKTATKKAAAVKPSTKKAGGSRSTGVAKAGKKAASPKSGRVRSTARKAATGKPKAKAQVKTKKKTAVKSTANTKKAATQTGKAQAKAKTKPTARAVKGKTRKTADKTPARKSRTPVQARKRPASAGRIRPQREVDEELTAKFVLGAATMQDESGQEARMDLPAGYGDHRLVMMVRDPYWVYCYWELQPQYVEEALSRLGRQAHEVRWVIRIHSQGGQAGTDHFDTEIDTRARSWYIHLAPPGATFTAEIGVRDGAGQYVAVVRSNSVTLPMDRPSANMDEQWMLSDEELHHHYAGMDFPHEEGMKPTGKATLFDEGQSGRPVQPGGASEYRPPSSSKK